MNTNHHNDDARDIPVFESNKLIRFMFTAVFVSAVFIIPPVATIQFFMV
jgi:hypothetical protein